MPSVRSSDRNTHNADTPLYGCHTPKVNTHPDNCRRELRDLRGKRDCFQTGFLAVRGDVLGRIKVCYSVHHLPKQKPSSFPGIGNVKGPLSPAPTIFPECSPLPRRTPHRPRPQVVPSPTLPQWGQPWLRTRRDSCRHALPCPALRAGTWGGWESGSYDVTYRGF